MQEDANLSLLGDGWCLYVSLPTWTGSEGNDYWWHAFTLVFYPTDCQPELPSRCPWCGENASTICCDIKNPDSFHSLQIPPLKVIHAMHCSHVKPVKLNERSTTDIKLVDALEDWCKETSKTHYGEAVLLNFGPSLIMSTKVLDCIINCIHHGKISSLQDLTCETHWDEVSHYGAELALIQAIHPGQTNALAPQSSSGAKKMWCGSCGQLGLAIGNQHKSSWHEKGQGQILHIENGSMVIFQWNNAAELRECGCLSQDLHEKKNIYNIPSFTL